MRRALPLLAAAALAAVLVIGLTQAGSNSGGGGDDGKKFDLAAAQRSLQGAPGPVGALHAQSAQLLAGGLAAFRSRLAALKGFPIVVNKWASWCGPCTAEFPIFQRVATTHGRTIAFVGLNAGDNRDDAASFLKRFPVPYPSYSDPDEKIARKIGAPANYPITLFYDKSGRQAFIHQGQYRTEADLIADIDRYLRRA